MKTKHISILTILLMLLINISIVSVNADDSWDPMIYDSPSVGNPPGNSNGVIDYAEAINAIQDYFAEKINYSQVRDVIALFEGGNVIVDDDAESSWYDDTHVATIQEGVNIALEDDIVFVRNGTYYENIVVNKSIYLVGENKENTIIDGQGFTTVYINSSSVCISDFTITNATTWSNDGIYIDSCSMISITNCNIYNNNGDGIVLYHSDKNIISDCNLHHNSYYYGIRMINSSWNDIIRCNMLNNVGAGILLWVDSNNNTISECLIANNDKGIVIRSHNFEKSENNKIFLNNFINNSEYNAYDLFSNKWDNGDYGNYWDDYTGVDSDGDGIGDTPYDINGSDNQDLYPLMEEFVDDITLPEVRILKPGNALYFKNKEIISSLKPVIIKNITIEVEAIDFSGIEKVEFHIDGVYLGEDNTVPYTWDWSIDSAKLFQTHKHTIKVVAFDNEGNQNETELIVKGYKNPVLAMVVVGGSALLVKKLLSPSDDSDPVEEDQPVEEPDGSVVDDSNNSVLPDNEEEIVTVGSEEDSGDLMPILLIVGIAVLVLLVGIYFFVIKKRL